MPGKLKFLPPPGHGSPDPARRQKARDYYTHKNLLDAFAPPTSLLPSAVSLEHWLDGMPITSQGQPASCATCACVTALRVALATKKLPVILASVRYTFYYARVMAYEEVPPPNYGLWLYDSFEAINSHGQFGFGDGVPGELQIDSGVFQDPNPFTWDEYNVEPTGEGPFALRDLTVTNRSLGLYPPIEMIKQALFRQRVVIMALELDRSQWYTDGSQLLETGVMELPYRTDDIVGGHTMAIIGYDDDGYGKYDGRGAFKVRNSWGPDFGDSGFWYCPYELVADAEAQPGAFNDYENFVYISQLHLSGHGPTLPATPAPPPKP